MSSRSLTRFVTVGRNIGVFPSHAKAITPLYRLYGVGSTQKNKVAIRKEGDKIRSYVLTRYMEYVKNYKIFIEKKFPSAVNIYRVFSIGTQDFLKDLKAYITLRLKYAPTETNLLKFKREEIELYYRMPRDMWKLSPVLLLSIIPFSNYVVFPLALMRPRFWLCSHFWSIQQRAEFSVLDLKDRLLHNRPVFRALQANLTAVDDENVKETFRKVLELLGSGVHPSVEDILKCKKLFETEPYGLNNLTYGHLSHLIRMHGLHRGLFRRKRLYYRAHLMHQMDMAITREGGPETLNGESLRNVCLIRGLNGSNLSNTQMVEWLQQWLAVSSAVSKDSYSMLLHCPILLAYNHPQNWVLIY